jgi:tetratricopeptide (TPR) repeat protein
MVNIGQAEPLPFAANPAPEAQPQDRGEILAMAVQHHQAGRLDEADGLYRLLLEVEPEFPDALHLSGLIRLARRQPGEAVVLIERALAGNPENAAYHANLGRAHAALGATEQALDAFRRAVEIDPASAESLASMGQLLRDAGRYGEAIQCLEEARQIQPGSADIESTLGSAYHAARQLEDAVACYRRAVEIAPDHAAAHSNLGLALFDLGARDDAVAHYSRAIELEPDAPAAHLNLGWALFGTADNGAARAQFEAAIKLAPDMSEAHNKLALCHLADGELDEAHAHFKRAAQLSVQPQRLSAPFKLSHDIDQMRHLYARGLAGDDIQKIIGAYESVRDSLPRHIPRDQVFTLSEAQRATLNPSYDGAYYVPECPALAESALGPGVRRKEVESAFYGSNPNLVVVDNFLSRDALTKLRAFCREATIWKDVKPGYLGTYLRDGFGQPLMLQIAYEMRRALPAIFADHPLIEMWSYKCDQELSGLDKHADCAAVNVNFWISPDEANCEPESGGLELFKAEAPLSWDFRRYNYDQAAMDAFLDENGRDSITVPHRCNRAIIFNSNLIHKTDDCHFRSGYINRRTNVTMLFGHRDNR